MSSVFDQKRTTALGGIALVALAGCGGADADASHADPEEVVVERLSVEVIDDFDHDSTAFTQGLELRDGVFYESTGIYGSSDIRLVEPGTGEVLASEALPDNEFAEGLTLTDDVIWQITWREGVAYQRDIDTLAVIDTFEYEGEGWGICLLEDHHTSRELAESSKQLVMSDGSSTLTFRDPVTFEERGSVEVTLDGEELHKLNELECVDGQVWANVWQTDDIVRIDPDTGEVGAVVDASGLLTEDEYSVSNVLNGIAEAEEEDTFYVTGKLWPRLFLVRFV